jgi:acetylornithine deacetylase/succinyl-diaminopimelate desuccinylase-like protein
VELKWTQIHADEPAACSQRLLGIAERHVGALGFQHRRMVSRAYHDSLFMARLCPTMMIFIPCRNGWSHRPDEYASPEAIRRGVSLLARTLIELAL